MISLYLMNRLKNVLFTLPEFTERLPISEIKEICRYFSFIHIKKMQPLCVQRGEVTHLRIPLDCLDQFRIIGMN